jgi:SagB-type dehydrogenase family enzyme
LSPEDLTIRLSGDQGTATPDGGEALQLEAATVAAMRTLIDTMGSVSGVVSATVGTGLADAQRVTPSSGATLCSPAEVVQGEEIRLAGLPRSVELGVSEALEARNSDRNLGPLALDDLATVLVHGARVRSWTDAEDGYQTTSRSAPSAGGRHPLDLKVIVRDVAGLDSGAWYFDAARCVLVRQSDLDRAAPDALRAVNAAAGGIEDAPATVFAVAYFQRTLSRYPEGAALVWRDAGVLLGYLHLVASAAGLASCIVGTAGQLVMDPDGPIGDVGALIIGARR